MKLRERSDVVVLVAWTIAVVIIAGARREFIGDGLRYVADAAAGVWKLGEPRWLLFPGLLTAWLALWRGLGVQPSTAHAINLFLALDLLSGVIFLLALRGLLKHIQVPTGRRALAIALAGACGPLLALSTDTAEPMVPAALGAMGLLLAAKARPDSDFSWYAVAGVTVICVAGLLYQGIILALGMLPAVMPRGSLFRRRTLLVAAAFAIGLWSGANFALAKASSASFGETALRFTRNGDNELYARWVKTSSSTPLVAAVLGPASGMSMPPHFTGVRAMLEGIPHRSLVSVVQALALIVGGVVFWILLGSAVVRRRGWLVAAACAILVLPLLRPSQYSYFKFYVLLPVFVALAAVNLKATVAATLLALLAPLNGYLTCSSLTEGRALFAERARAYERASANDCWVTASWIPAVPQIWPGRSCSLLATLSSGRGSAMEQLMAEQKASLKRCFRWCYCEARSVWTDDMVASRLDQIRDLALYFQAQELLSARLLWTDATGIIVLRGQAGLDVLQFEERARKEACASLSQ